MVMPYHLHMPSYFLETFTEYPPEKGVGKNNIGNGKIMAGAGAIEDTAGEKQKLGVLRHFVCLQINFYVGFSATAMKNRCVC